MRRGKKEGILTYNDYELIYLIRIGDYEIKDILIKKYEPLVHKMISNFNVSSLNKEDYLQEGRLIINKAIDIYNDESKMTFTKFVEMLLYHRFIDLNRKKKNNDIELLEIDEIEYLYSERNESVNLKEEIDIRYFGFSKFEQTIYEYKVLKGISSKKISEILNIPIKKVYSATDRMLKKIKRL